MVKIDTKKIKTQDQLSEKAPIDEVEDRVDAKMKTLKGRAKRTVAEGLKNKKLAKEGEKLEQQGKRDWEDATKE